MMIGRGNKFWKNNSIVFAKRVLKIVGTSDKLNNVAINNSMFDTMRWCML